MRAVSPTGGQLLRRRVPKMPRLTSRPRADAADRGNARNADEPRIAPTTPPSSGSGAVLPRDGPGRERGTGAGVSGRGAAGGGAERAARRAGSRSYADSRSTAAPYFSCNGEAETTPARSGSSTAPI